MWFDYSKTTPKNIEKLSVVPLIGDKPMPNGEVVGDALSVISLKNLADDAEPDRVVKRNSYRSLHQPDISGLDWVNQSGKKEEVCQCLFLHYRRTITLDFWTNSYLLNSHIFDDIIITLALRRDVE